MMRVSRTLLLVGILAGVPCHAQSSAERPAKDPSHRIIPLANPKDAPNYREVVPKEILDLWQRLQDVGNQRPAEPRFRTMPESQPGFLAQDSTELLRELSEQAGRTMVEAMNTDIAEFAQEANRRFLENLRGTQRATEQPVPPAAEQDTIPPENPDQLAFDPSVDVDRNLQQLLSQFQDHQQEFDQLLRQYQQSWPAESVPPREWIRKVQPFINQELVQQLSEAAEQLRAERARAAKTVGPRPSERNSVSSNSSPSGRRAEVHSNPVVASVLQAFDNQSTSLIKSATRRKRSDKGRSWWKSLRARSQRKVRAWNREFTENVREIAATSGQRMPAGRDLVWSPRSPSTSATLIALAFMLCGCLLAIWGFAGRRRLRVEDAGSPSEEPPDPEAIRDRASLLTVLHALGWQLFGVRSRFWHHRQFFMQLKKITDLDSRSLDALREMYERARYGAHETTLSREDLATARQLVGSILKRSVVTP